MKYFLLLYHKMSLNTLSIAHAISKVRASGSVTGTVNFAIGGRPSAKLSYMSNGYKMNANGYLADPSRSAQIAANNAGALTRTEATRMGLSLGGRH